MGRKSKGSSGSGGSGGEGSSKKSDKKQQEEEPKKPEWPEPVNYAFSEAIWVIDNGLVASWDGRVRVGYISNSGNVVHNNEQIIGWYDRHTRKITPANEGIPYHEPQEIYYGPVNNY